MVCKAKRLEELRTGIWKLEVLGRGGIGWEGVLEKI
jgi:hypothetical protein